MRRAIRLLGVVVTAVLVATGLVGCSADGDLDPDAAARLQEAVAEVVSAAEQGRFEAAQAAVAEVRAALSRAADDGAVSLARYRQIDEALTRTEAELAAALQAVAEDAAARQAAADQAAAEQAAAEQAAAEQAAGRAEPGPADRGPGGPGPGDGKGGPGRGDERQDHRGPGKHG